MTINSKLLRLGNTVPFIQYSRINGRGIQGSTATSKKTATRNSKKAKSPAEGRGDTKKAIVLELLRRKEGATIAEIVKATDWQNHSIRGFISGTVAKKLGLVVESSKTQAGERNYQITS